MTASTTETLITSLTQNVGNALETSLTLIVGVVAGLTALAIAIRYFRRWVGRK